MQFWADTAFSLFFIPAESASSAILTIYWLSDKILQLLLPTIITTWVNMPGKSMLKFPGSGG